MSKGILGHSFQFWQNYFEIAENTSNPEEFVYSIVRYVFTGETPKKAAAWSKVDCLLWAGIFPSINCSHRQMNRNQGAPVGNNNGPNGRRGNNQSTNQSTNQTNRNIEIEIEKEEEIEENTPSQNDFIPPSLSEVEEYSRKLALKRRPIKGKKYDAPGFAKWFIAHFEERGWTNAAGNKMKSWKDAARALLDKDIQNT